MAKSKSKTTGLPAPARRDPNARKYRSRSERDAYHNRLALMASGILGAVIILILVVALVIEGVIVPNQPVASVNGQTISTTAFQKHTVLWGIQALARALSMRRSNHHSVIVPHWLQASLLIIQQQLLLVWWFPSVCQG